MSLVVSVILIIIVTYIIQLLTPPVASPVVESTIVTQNFDQTTSDLSAITFSGNELNITSPAKIVKTSPVINESVLVNTVIETLQLQQVSEGIWENDSWKLLHVKNPGYYELLNKKKTDSFKTVEKNQAINLAQNFVVNTLKVQNHSPIDQSLTFYSGLVELKETNEFKANIIQIPFSYTVDGYPVYVGQQQALPIRIMVNSNQEITKVTFNPLPFEYAALENVNPISVDQAVNNMNEKNLGSFIYAYKPEFTAVDLSSAITGTLKTVSFEYRYDEQKQTIYPFYRFTGTLQENNGTPFEAEIITPAI